MTSRETCSENIAARVKISIYSGEQREQKKKKRSATDIFTSELSRHFPSRDFSFATSRARHDTREISQIIREA